MRAKDRICPATEVIWPCAARTNRLEKDFSTWMKFRDKSELSYVAWMKSLVDQAARFKSLDAWN
jgi:hypothetical protein